METTFCVGIDPAPSSKGSAIVEYLAGESPAKIRLRRNVSHPELRADLCRWKSEHPSVLIAWDAPLTGPQDPEANEAGGSGVHSRADFTMRDIEKEIRDEIPDEVEGISVVGYAGCPHWTITRNLLGLPRVGPFDREWDALPYSLLWARPEFWSGHYVLEVHPAVALWAWLKDSDTKITDWRYKRGSRQSQREISGQLLAGLECYWQKLSLYPFVAAIRENRAELIESNDLLDALVAAALAALFIPDSARVDLRGNRSRGAMLLPVASTPLIGQKRHELTSNNL